MTTSSSPTHLSDRELIAHVHQLADNERAATAQLIASLAEFDRLRLYLGEGCSSLFTYCTQVLHLSEHAAYSRIEAARASRRFPVLLDQLADGRLTLTSVCLLAPHLTTENHGDVLDSARHKSKREVEELVARLRPRPPVAATVRKLPAPSPSAGAASGASIPHAVSNSETTKGDDGPVERTSTAKRSATVQPLTPAHYKVQLTISAETHVKLRRVQDLLRHTVPNGDPAVIFDRALTLLLGHLEKTKLAATEKPRRAQRGAGTKGRHIPATVKRAVWNRDRARCAYVGTQGRCTETGFLEFHHVQPFAEGGEARVENIQLRCRAHNAYEAGQHFGLLDDDCLVRETPVASLRARSGPS